MSTSKEVFELRRQGQINQAYNLAVRLINDEPQNEWNIKALAWCLIDLIKSAVSENNAAETEKYLEQLESLNIDQTDEILQKSISKVRLLANPQKRIILKAQEKSRNGEHNEALQLFREAYRIFPDDEELNINYAWELQKEAKLLFDEKEINLHKAKSTLAEYIKLKNERPSQLHSIFLNYAYKIKDEPEFDYVIFLKLWNLNNLREDDLAPNYFEGKSYPGIAEKTIQHAAKTILSKNQVEYIEFFMPYLDVGITKFSDNIWLTYYKAKLLFLNNQKQKAVEFLIPVIKEKITEYWTWSLLGELFIDTDEDTATSAYCKALLCKSEEKFLSKTRTKLTTLLINKNHLNEAKTEINTLLKAKQLYDIKLDNKISEYSAEDWFKKTDAKENNIEFYISQKAKAENFVFKSLEWIDGCAGNTYSTKENPDKIKRKIYLKYNNEIIEAKITEKNIAGSLKLDKGDSIRAKGEYDKNKKFKLFLLERRQNIEKWDIFEWQKGNATHFIKKENNRLEGYVISVLTDEKIYEGILNSNELPQNSEINEGKPVYVKYFISDKIKQKIDIILIKERNDGKLWDIFPDYVGIIYNVNVEKGTAHFIVNKNINGVIKLMNKNSEISIGSKVLVKVRKIIKPDGYYYIALEHGTTDIEPADELLKPFSGYIEISGPFGFADDVYIDEHLINKFNISHGQVIEGKALLNYNKKKERWGWKAIEITKI